LSFGDDIEVRSLALDSRKATPGALLFAIPDEGRGTLREERCGRGAVAVVAERTVRPGALVIVPSVRRALGVRPTASWKSVARGARLRRHRHERQDDDDFSSRDPRRAAMKPSLLHVAYEVAAEVASSEHDARRARTRSAAATRSRAGAARHGVLLARARPGAHRRRAFPGRRLHELLAG